MAALWLPPAGVSQQCPPPNLLHGTCRQQPSSQWLAASIGEALREAAEELGACNAAVPGPCVLVYRVLLLLEAVLCRLRFADCYTLEAVDMQGEVSAFCQEADRTFEALSGVQLESNAASLGKSCGAMMRNELAPFLQELLLAGTQASGGARHPAAQQQGPWQSPWPWRGGEGVWDAPQPLGVSDTSLAAQALRGVPALWIVILGAGKNAEDQDDTSAHLLDGRGEVPAGWRAASSRGNDGGAAVAGAVLFEASKERADALRREYAGRKDVYVLNAHTRPGAIADQVDTVLLVADHPWGGEARDARASTHRAPHLFPHYFQVDVDNGDCDFLAGFLTRFQPRFVQIELLQLLVPPDVHYSQHFEALESGLQSATLSDMYPGLEHLHLRGCSLGAALDVLGPDYALVSLLQGTANAEFMHVDALPPDGSIRAARTREEVENAWRIAVLAAPWLWLSSRMHHGARFDHRLLLDGALPASEKARLLSQQVQFARGLGHVVNVTIAPRYE